MTTTTQDTTPTCERCTRMQGPPRDRGFSPPIMYVARLIPTYWGTWLCPDCAQTVASSNDLARSWPPLPDPDAAG